MSVSPSCPRHSAEVSMRVSITYKTDDECVWGDSSEYVPFGVFSEHIEYLLGSLVAGFTSSERDSVTVYYELDDESRTIHDMFPAGTHPLL